MIIVFSLGMLLYELLALEMPFNDLKIFEVPNAITRGDKQKLPELGDEYSPLIDIHNDCIQLDPSLRPSTKDLASKIGLLFSRLTLDKHSVRSGVSSSRSVDEGLNVS